MEKTLSETDRNRLDGLIKDAEKRTGSQIVLAVIQKCDSYTELPWKAFALGAAVAGVLAVCANFPVYAWSSRTTVLIASGATLAGGALLAILAVFIPGFAKRFLSAYRAEAEVRQYAESVFLERELFATRGRTGILLLVSLFERRVIVLPDSGLKQRLSAEALQEIIAAMTLLLKCNAVGKALEAGLERLVHILETVTGAADENELLDEIIEEKGV